MLRTLLLACLLVLGGAGPARAAVGDLDPRFGGDGRTIVDLGADDGASAMAIAPDGKIVVAGSTMDADGADIVVVRFNADGSLDASFSGDGVQTTDLGSYDGADGVAVQPDGKIVVGADGPDDALLRYDAGGSLDASFGTGGIQIVDFAIDDIALQPDGRIVAAGSAFVSTQQRLDLTVARFEATGVADTSFGSFGVKVDRLLGPDPSQSVDSAARAIAIAADGGIVVAGVMGSVRFGGLWDVAIVRYTAAGDRDDSFAGDGLAQIHGAGLSQTANDVAIQADGRIVTAGDWTGGGIENRQPSAVFLTRITAGGALDQTFSGDGMQTTVVSAGVADEGSAIAPQPDGRLVVGGTGGFELLRYGAAGALDPAFSGDGIQATPIGAGEASAAAVALLGDCAILVAGDVGGDLALARYENACAGCGASCGAPISASGDGAATPAGRQRARTALSLRGSRRVGRTVAATVSCARTPCDVTVRGTVLIAGRAPIALGGVVRTIQRRGVAATFTLRVPAATRRAIRRGLFRGRATRLRVSAEIVQPGGRSRTLRRTMRFTLR